ncbi:MAG TPA: hypothetical protein VE422_12755 [Terriglobia bacterium]|nr:hypothetical protein [Terriglobia bacterium]
MPRRFIVVIVFVASVAVVMCSSGVTLAQTWNTSGLPRSAFQPSEAKPDSTPAPPRDLTGTWDAGPGGVFGPGHVATPFTPWAEERLKDIKPGNGPRAVTEEFINDPLSIMCDPAGFPRLVLYELRPVQIVQTPNQILMLYMFEKRWRVIWTDGRALPKNPDPRWYGYSVGRWEDDYTFVVQTIGMDDRTWLDNAGNPHSIDMRVEERYHRRGRDTLELTVTIDDPTAYIQPWTPLNKLPLKLMPLDADLMEMICSPTEAAAYKKLVDTQKK